MFPLADVATLLQFVLRLAMPQIPWLIAIAFWLSGGFIRSGLGARIAYSIVSLFGKTTLVSEKQCSGRVGW